MRRRHSKFRVIMVAPVVAALAACGSGGSEGASEDVEFTTSPSGDLQAWGFDNADDVGQARLDYAEGELGDVTIKLDGTSFDAQKFTAQQASGNVADVVQMDRSFVPTYAAQGLIVPLDECFKAYDVDPEERFYPWVVDDVTYQDQAFAVPQFYQPPAIILNKRVMDAAGVSKEQIDTSNPDALLGAIEAMYKEDGGVPSTLGFDPVATGQASLWVLATGGKLVDDQGKPTLDDPANEKALEMLKRITDAQGGYAKVKSFSDSFDTFGEENQFVADQVGSQVDAQWYANVLSPYLDSIDIEAVPFKGADGSAVAVAGGTAFAIPAGAKNPDAACSWMVQITNLESWTAAADARAKTLTDEGGVNTGLFTGSPEADTTIREKYVKPTGNAGMDQVIATYYEVLGDGKSQGATPAGQDLANELNNAVTAVLLDQKDPKSALADAQRAAMRSYDNITAGQ